MGILELLLIAVSLSMDAFAVSACIGLSVTTDRFSKAITAGLYFGTAQAVMPLAGSSAGTLFAGRITAFSGYIAFVILAVIGGKMIKESLGKPDKSDKLNIDADVSFRKMFPLAVATSIDALAVGVSFAMSSVNIFAAVGFIGIITFVFGAAGVQIGGMLGGKFKSKAEFAGGLVLVLIGVKILLEHIGII